MKMKLILLFLIFVKLGFSQETTDLLRIGTQISPKIETDTNSTAKLIGYNAQLLFPKVLKDSNFVIVGVQFQHYSLRFYEIIGFNNSVYNLAFPISYSRKISNKWKLNSTITPQLSTDFGDISIEDFKLRETFIFVRKKSNYRKFKVGLAINHEYFGVNVVPLIGWYFLSKNEIHSLNILLPNQITYKCKFAKNFYSGISYQAMVESYRLNENLQNAYVEQFNSGFSAFIEFVSKKNFFVSTNFGTSVNRQFNTFPNNRKYSIMIDGIGLNPNKNSYNIDLKDGIFVEFKMGFRINQK